jgi:hypothetical protein
MAELTKNQNFLQPTGYKITIERVNYPNLEFFVQSVQHPSVSVPMTDVGYPRASVFMPGDKLVYDEVTFDLLLDEDMNAYIEMHNWLKRLVEDKVRGASERPLQVPTTADITLTLLSSHNNVTKQFIYRDCIPTNIGGVQMSSNVTDVAYINVPMGFAFTYFDIV